MAGDTQLIDFDIRAISLFLFFLFFFELIKATQKPLSLHNPPSADLVVLQKEGRHQRMGPRHSSNALVCEGGSTCQTWGAAVV